MSVAIVVTRTHVCDVCGSSDGVGKARLVLLDDANKVISTRTVELCSRTEDGEPGHLTPIKEAMDARDVSRPGNLRKPRKQARRR